MEKVKRKFTFRHTQTQKANTKTAKWKCEKEKDETTSWVYKILIIIKTFTSLNPKDIWQNEEVFRSHFFSVFSLVHFYCLSKLWCVRKNKVSRGMHTRTDLICINPLSNWFGPVDFVHVNPLMIMFFHSFLSDHKVLCRRKSIRFLIREKLHQNSNAFLLTHPFSLYSNFSILKFSSS